MQNGVFLHTKEDINTGCLRTLFLITLFKFTADVIDDFKERHYWSTSQTSHIDCKSRMNKSFFFPPLSPPLRKRLYNQSISVTYMGSLGAKSALLKSSLSKDVWSSDCRIKGPWRTFRASHQTQQFNLTASSFIRCGNSSIYSLICGILHK